MTRAVRQVRRARHILDPYYSGPSDDPNELEIWAYTDCFTYRPGDVVELRVSTTAPTWSLDVARDGVELITVLSERGLQGAHHPTAADASIVGCDWPVGYRFEIDESWKPGGYLITVTGERGGETVEEHHIIFVGSAPGVEPSIALLVTTGTWVAYNDWGGWNAYEGPDGPDDFGRELSLRRPWTRGFCRLPDGAPRTVPDVPPVAGEMVRYPYMEWAYAYGYSKKYASAGWATYEGHFARWAEQSGYAFDPLTQHDLDADPTALDPYDVVVVVGHDEYWTDAQRDVLDGWVAQRGRVARFAGDFVWRVRLENDGATQVCYKHMAAEEDPLRGTDLVSGPWESAAIDRPGAETFGANGLEGIYGGLGRCVGGGPGGFTVYRPDHWVFEGTGLGYGDVLGAESRVFGYEVDGLDLIVEDGLPRPTGRGNASPDIEILGVGLATVVEVDQQVWGETLYIGDGDVGLKAETLYGESTEETRRRAARGNGVIISWVKGRGEVFTAGTCEWVAGLLRGDREIQRITRNVLDRFLGS